MSRLEVEVTFQELMQQDFQLLRLVSLRYCDVETSMLSGYSSVDNLIGRNHWVLFNSNIVR